MFLRAGLAVVLAIVSFALHAEEDCAKMHIQFTKISIPKTCDDSKCYVEASKDGEAVGRFPLKTGVNSISDVSGDCLNLYVINQLGMELPETCRLSIKFANGKLCTCSHDGCMNSGQLIKESGTVKLREFRQKKSGRAKNADDFEEVPVSREPEVGR